MSQAKRSDPFAELYGDFADRLRGDRWQPDVDVVETESAIVVRVELAGVRSENLRVTIDSNVLRVSGVRLPADASGVKRLHQMEIAAGPFERRVRVPVPIETDGVSAHLADGFLTISLRKRMPVRRSIEVEHE
ncbi:MAG: Hsp20/alpha crystallin family protein [Myxococcales bacterium]|nr:Hsp20/alpha crystallin family protein [Myxococcales bacterium]MDH5308107.1 Hsp20/alpha crystallin family protein [Myxococcales bacterium]MDH5567256.1 Hsp20/alpha crystallin family protein [Myxococcales bacterium]